MKFLATTIVFLLLSINAQAEERMPKQQWLSNLQPMMGKHLCAAQSPFLSVYKEPIDTCPAKVESLFKKCTKDEPKVNLPSHLSSVSQANLYGQIIAECISAHHQGGSALKTFYMIQDIRNKQGDG